jgi:putative ubiquitin-RnfH superfamily antitoxin RatB of RatAB toxin-antitoxin module
MKIRVDVVLALPLSAQVVRVELEEGATVADALAAFGLSAAHPELDIRDLRVGIWGRRASPDDPLRDRDRVEIYRPLTADPKAARRERARDRRKDCDAE